MLKGTKLYSVFTGTCPRCMEGKIYPSSNPYVFKNLTKVNKTCSECGLKFEPEPMFFTGAMYVSYAFSVALVVSVFTGAHILYEDPSVNWMIFIGVAAAFIFAPLNIRLSRSIWLNIFVKYDPNKGKVVKMTEGSN